MRDEEEEEAHDVLKNHKSTPTNNFRQYKLKTVSKTSDRTYSHRVLY